MNAGAEPEPRWDESLAAERREGAGGVVLLVLAGAAGAALIISIAATLVFAGVAFDDALSGWHGNAWRLGLTILPCAACLLALAVLLAREAKRRRVEQSVVREREVEFRTVMDNAPVAFFFKDRQRRYRLVNRRFRDWSRAPIDYIGRTDEEIYPPEFAELSRSSDEEVLNQGRIVQAERPTHHAREGIDLLLLTKFPIRDPDGAIVGVAGVLVDVTARARTEAALRQSRELLIESQRLGRTGYIVSDLANNRVYWSETLFELRKVQPRPFFTFDETMEFLHPEDRPKYMAARNAAVEARTDFQVDLRVIRGDGSLSWESSIGHPNFDRHGKFAGVLVVLRDITESKFAEEALKSKEAELRAILDNAPMAIFLKDRSRRYRIINRTYTQWFGDDAARLVGHTAHEIYPGDFAAMVEEGDRAVLEQGLVAQTERAPVGARAELYHVLATKFPIRDDTGAIVGLAGFITDVSARWNAEQAVRQSEERFRALIEHSSDVVAVVRRDGLVTYRSPSMADRLGYTPEERWGGSIFDLLHPDDLETATTTFAAVSVAPGRRADGRSRLRHKNGTWRRFAWTARNATDVAGIDGIIVNARDVTEAHHLEQQLQQAHKTEAIGRLAGGIAHDFNNILGAILGFAGFLTQDLPTGTPEHGFAERILSAAERGKEIVRQILAFSRRGDLERSPHDLKQIVRETEPLLRAAIPSSTRLELDLPQDDVIAEVNAGQVSQILLNLCINANDALMGKPGRVTISLSRVVADAGTLAGDLGHGQRDELGVTRLASGTLKPGQGYAAIVVADTGVGMTAEVAQQIFDPFFTTKERGQGTGLGLSVVNAIVMAHEGACSVSTRVGVGSVLAIYLPLADAAAVTEPEAPKTRRLAGRERVLIVDDEVMVADMLAIGLDRLGYEAVTLNDPEEALEIVTADPSAWDVIVSDQVMPGMKGLTLFQGIRRVSKTLHMILCTGFSDGNAEEEAMALGIDAFFLKPVSPEQLAAAIRRIVDGHSDPMPIYRAQGQRH